MAVKYQDQRQNAATCSCTAYYEFLKCRKNNVDILLPPAYIYKQGPVGLLIQDGGEQRRELFNGQVGGKWRRGTFPSRCVETVEMAIGGVSQMAVDGEKGVFSTVTG